MIEDVVAVGGCGCVASYIDVRPGNITMVCIKCRLGMGDKPANSFPYMVEIFLAKPLVSYIVSIYEKSDLGPISTSFRELTGILMTNNLMF